jgi:acyl-CoA dehydrogenase
MAIARADEMIVSETGSYGTAMVLALRQLVARFFLAGFGTEEQKSEWLGRVAEGSAWPAIAISEPSVGAHPKHLGTLAVRDRGSYRLSGRKTWITNGVDATFFLVLAITAMVAGRKRYGMFIVPRRAEGLDVNEMDLAGALAPASHAELVLTNCRVSADSCLGDPEEAYSSMAEPFRDVEDVVMTAGSCGFATWLISRTARHLARTDENIERIGRAAALLELCRAGAYRGVGQLDEGAAPPTGLAAGVRLLVSNIVSELRQLMPEEAVGDEQLTNALAGFDVVSSTARKARAARLSRLGTAFF